MKISLNWLKDYVAYGVAAEKLAHRLTMAGLEVEKISSVADDTVFELEITPNRPDCLNVLGIARETAAALNKPLKAPALKKISFPKLKADIQIENKKDCSRYIGAVVENVRVGASSEWFKKRLEPIGTRSINNVVDITNFCLMEMGQPLHAFDYDKLTGGKIMVRRAKAGETIVTIDGIERKLDPSILVIADAKGPVAVAGVMGGKETEVDENTKNILLESAYFDPVLIRRAARKMGLSSDSSYRFERGVDIEGVAKAASRALNLIKQEGGGLLKKYTDVFPAKAKIKRPSMTVSVAKVNAFLGADIPSTRCAVILKKLGFEVRAKKGNLKVVPPAFRNDVKTDVDVVEEIARIVGYDNLPLTYPSVKIAGVASEANWTLKKRIRENLLAQGLDEIITYTMTSREALKKSGIDNEGIRIQNPLSKDQEFLRPSLLPSFLSVLASNFNHGQRDLKLFEIGRTYENFPEKEKLGILLTGDRSQDWRTAKKEQVDFYDLKGILEGLYLPLDISGTFEWSAGSISKIPQDILNNWDIKQKDVYFAEISLEKLSTKNYKTKRYQTIIEFPSVTRDVSIAVKKDVSFEQIRQTALQLGQGILQSVNFIEQYLGEKIPSGQKGLVFSLVYQSPQRTLREDEVNAVHEAICQALVRDLGAIRR